MACINKDDLEFLKTLLEMVEDVGPEGVQEICARGNSECVIDQANFQSQIAQARAALDRLGCEPVK